MQITRKIAQISVRNHQYFKEAPTARQIFLALPSFFNSSHFHIFNGIRSLSSCFNIIYHGALLDLNWKLEWMNFFY